ncbi:MAG TPA: hypothetical protein VEI03_22605 [Stellaceae bacterium]|nr:hypothetical protein [Stellaceae bacterium]
MLFGGAILDTVLGIVLVFLLVSLMASATQELIASIFAWRTTTFKEGIAQLLADEKMRGIAKEIYMHGLV